VFEEAFDREDLAEDDPDAMEDPLMKIDLFVIHLFCPAFLLKPLAKNFHCVYRNF
jgi:hypothetical protein